MRSTLALALSVLLLPACMVGTGDITGTGDETGGGGNNGGGGGGGNGGGDNGGGDNGGGDTQPTPRVTGSVDKTTVSTELGKTETLMLTISSVDGFAGPVTISPSVVNGLDSVTGWTLTATPASVTLAAGESQTVELSVKVPTDNVALSPTLNVGLDSSAEAVAMTSAFTVANQLTITIPSGAGTGVHSMLPSQNTPIRIHQGAKIIFHNADNRQHVIHGNGGIPHENTGAGQAGTDYTVTPTSDATWYCHDHEQGAGINRPVLVLP